MSTHAVASETGLARPMYYAPVAPPPLMLPFAPYQSLFPRPTNPTTNGPMYLFRLKSLDCPDLSADVTRTYRPPLHTSSFNFLFDLRLFVFDHCRIPFTPVAFALALSCLASIHFVSFRFLLVLLHPPCCVSSVSSGIPFNFSFASFDSFLGLTERSAPQASRSHHHDYLSKGHLLYNFNLHTPGPVARTHKYTFTCLRGTTP
jgi:hypothetical protein